MFEKNEIVTLTIEDISETGEGIGHAEGITLFVKNSVPGDTVRARILKMKKTYGFARVEELVTPGTGRVEPPCPIAGPCGGCQLQFLSYEEQLRLKQKKVKDCLERIGGFTDLEVPPVLGMQMPWNYRNKAQFPVGLDREGKPALGFYAGHSHVIIPTNSCPTLFPQHTAILAAIKTYLQESGATPYNETTGKGLVRHVLMRYAKATGELMVCLVINGKSIPKREKLISALRQISGMKSICLNHNTQNTNVILGETITVLWGEAYITDNIGDVTYHISPLSFYQVNPAQTKVLYDTAMSFAGLTGTETVWDLYCGIGTISLFLAKKASKVYGVEIVPDAIRDARENAALNHLTNTEFYVGAAEEVLPAHRKDHPEPVDVIVVDPPRKGCEETLLETMLTMAPKRIVYVSCDPATLARDLKLLCEKEYRVEKVQAVDMFPQTGHVETVVALHRTNS